jgi:hypothetical protein
MLRAMASLVMTSGNIQSAYASVAGRCPVVQSRAAPPCSAVSRKRSLLLYLDVFGDTNIARGWPDMPQRNKYRPLAKNIRPGQQVVSLWERLFLDKYQVFPS